MQYNHLFDPIVAGVVTAITIDIHAWIQNPGTEFNFKIASKRWIAGALIGALALIKNNIGI
jgi:hypothetical protein